MAQRNFNKEVYVVHCVDTEGPIYESIESTFDRLKLLFNVDLKPTKENLRKLQNIEINLKGKEEIVANCISPKRLSFIENWHQLDVVLNELFSESFRKRFADSYGNRYLFNWYCIDHVGFKTNPRRRTLGYHAILEHYLRWIRETEKNKDRIYWHYHGVPFNRAANCFGTNWSFSNEHIQVLCRRVIDYGMFPCSYRPGGHIERPDMNLWLEQWIPFDYGNQAMLLEDKDKQPDFSNGRFADWRRSPKEWGAYHPDYFDYQIHGNMKRYIFRCLNLESRLGSINQCEVDKAFEMADRGKKTVLAVTNHDNRDMRDEIEKFYGMLLKSTEKYPEVKFKYANAVDAARMALDLDHRERLEFELEWKELTLHITASHDIWGPHPFLAIKTKEGKYYHDNLDNQYGNRWSYTFDWMTIEKEALACVGIGSNDDYGNTTVIRWFQTDEPIVKTYENLSEL